MSAEAKKECCERLDSHLVPEFFKALGEPNRLQILSHLATTQKPHTVSQLADCCPVDISVVSRHLKALKSVGILEAMKTGKEVRYRIPVSKIAGRLRALADALEACCPNGECTFTQED